MTIKLNLYIPGIVVPKIRVRPDQKISTINHVKIFSQQNKMLFVSKGRILSYNRTMNEYDLSNDDSIFALKIKENDTFLIDFLQSNEEQSISKIQNKITIFGPCYEANLSSINKILIQSLNSNLSKEKVIIHGEVSLREVARIQDIKSIRRENCRKAWKKQIKSYLNNESSQFVCCELSNVNYESPKEPCCDALPTLL